MAEVARLDEEEQAEHERRWEDKQLAAGLLQFGEYGRFVLKAQEPLPSVAWMASQLDALRTQARAAELVQSWCRPACACAYP